MANSTQENIQDSKLNIPLLPLNDEISHTKCDTKYVAKDKYDFLIISHRIIRFCILFQTLHILKKLSLFKNKYLFFILQSAVYFVVFSVVAFYISNTFFLSIFNCDQTSTIDLKTDVILIILYNTIFLIMYITFFIVRRRGQYLDEECEPKFIQSPVCLNSGFRYNNKVSMLFYVVAFFIMLFEVSLLIEISQFVAFEQGIDYTNCSTQFSYQILQTSTYVLPIYILVALLWNSAPLVFSLSIYFICNRIHDKIYAAIDRAILYIVKRYNGEDIIEEEQSSAPLPGYYKVVEKIDVICPKLKNTATINIWEYL